MKFNRLNTRRAILVLVVLVMLGIYVARLMNIQIVQAEEIRSRLAKGSSSTQAVKATRGEITDRNGVSLVSNSLGYDVIFDMAFLPSADQNDIILDLINMFEQAGAAWIDNLPISTEPPFRFLPEYETAQARLKSALNIHDFSTVEDTMFRLVEKYKLEKYSQSDARKIAGVRYEMDRLDFNYDNPYTFARDIDIDLVLQIKERSYALGGVDISESAIRHYDRGNIAPHLIGRVGPIQKEEWEAEDSYYRENSYFMNDIVGLSGVESALEAELRGHRGERVITMDAYGKVLDAEENTPPVPGNTVALTIDTRLQDVAQQAIAAQIDYLQRTAKPGEGKEADKGAVVAIHPKTGQILACATYPSYDLNTFSQDYDALLADELEPLYNRALMGVYAPGSTFKPVVGAAGLATGHITEQSTVFCGHVYTRFQDYQPRCLGSHSNINVVRALSLSCNIFFYDVGWNIGIENIDTYAKQFGLGEPTGIELRELIGQRSNPEAAEERGEKWGGGAVLQSAIGQLYHGFTPLQLANYTATIANRGERMKVSIVKEIQDYSRGEVLQPFEAQVADRVDASPAVFDTVIRSMIAASRTGTAAAHFGSYPFDVASKTGTPESAQYPNSTFICFGPAEDPEIAIAVVIENGWHGYTGAPVAKAIMDEYFGIQSANPLLPREEVSELETARDLVEAASGAEWSQETDGEVETGSGTAVPDADTDESDGNVASSPENGENATGSA